MKFKTYQCSNGSVMLGLESICKHENIKISREEGVMNYIWCKDCQNFQCPKCGEFSEGNWWTNYICEECSKELKR
jgi:hypothetical protein